MVRFVIGKNIASRTKALEEEYRHSALVTLQGSYGRWKSFEFNPFLEKYLNSCISSI